MKVKRIVVLTMLIAAAVIYAQDVADIFNELKTKTVSVPLPVAPAPEPAAEMLNPPLPPPPPMLWAMIPSE